MFNRFHHGHSLGAGVLGGVLLAGHVWALFVLGVCVGIALAYARQSAAWFAGAWREHQENRQRPRRTIVEVIPRFRSSSQTDDVPY